MLAGSAVGSGTDRPPATRRGLQEEATMSIANIAGSSAWSHQLTGSNAMANLVGAAAKAPTANANPASSGSLMHDIVSTLQHLVLPGSVSSAAAAAGAASASAASATTATASKSAQDLQSFMASLIQALHQAGGPGGGAASTQSSHGKHGGHGHVSTQLQSLLQEIDGGSAPAASTVASASTGPQGLSTLETSFQSLMQDLSSGTAAGTSASQSGTPSLQSFLQTLLTNLQTQGSTQSAGLLIHATA
jgi:trimeric autotransporter adhesin